METHLKFHLFAFGPSDVSSGARPQVTSWGPYTYRVFKRKLDVSTEADGQETIRYGQRKVFRFEPRLSCVGCSEDDSLTVVNLNLLTLVKVFESNPGANTTLIKELNDAIGDTGTIFRDSLIQRDKVSDRIIEQDHFLRLCPQVRNLLFDGHVSNSLRWFKAKYSRLWYSLPYVVHEDHGFALLRHENDTVFE